MKLQINTGECAQVVFPTRPHSTGALRILDEHGNVLLMVYVTSDQENVEIDVVPYRVNYGVEHHDDGGGVTYTAPQPKTQEGL